MHFTIQKLTGKWQLINQHGTKVGRPFSKLREAKTTARLLAGWRGSVTISRSIPVAA